MDLSQALDVCRGGVPVRDDVNMAQGWTIRWEPAAKPKWNGDGLFRFYNPKGEAAHAVVFYDTFKASYAWRDVPL